jgi:DNA-binding FadR family transcriptional regulator
MNLPDLTGTPFRAIILSEKHECWTLVSAHRYAWLIETNWNISWGSRTPWQRYAKRNIGPGRATVRMHRAIMQAIEPKPEEEADALFVDHGNGQTLDNTDENLAWVTPAQNAASRRGRILIPSLEQIVAAWRSRQPVAARELEDVPF